MKIVLSIMILSISLCMGFTQLSFATVTCLCNDKTLQVPDCGICGSQLGVTEKTNVGVACICYNNLLSQEIPCSKICKYNGGWTGEFGPNAN